MAFYGVVLDGPGGSVATVTEYMVNGSLRNALQKSERYFYFYFCLNEYLPCLSVVLHYFGLIPCFLNDKNLLLMCSYQES